MQAKLQRVGQCLRSDAAESALASHSSDSSANRISTVVAEARPEHPSSQHAKSAGILKNALISQNASSVDVQKHEKKDLMKCPEATVIMAAEKKSSKDSSLTGDKGMGASLPDLHESAADGQQNGFKGPDAPFATVKQPVKRSGDVSTLAAGPSSKPVPASQKQNGSKSNSHDGAPGDRNLARTGRPDSPVCRPTHSMVSSRAGAAAHHNGQMLAMSLLQPGPGMCAQATVDMPAILRPKLEEAAAAASKMPSTGENILHQGKASSVPADAHLMLGHGINPLSGSLHAASMQLPHATRPSSYVPGQQPFHAGNVSHSSQQEQQQQRHRYNHRQQLEQQCLPLQDWHQQNMQQQAFSLQQGLQTHQQMQQVRQPASARSNSSQHLKELLSKPAQRSLPAAPRVSWVQSPVAGHQGAAAWHSGRSSSSGTGRSRYSSSVSSVAQRHQRSISFDHGLPQDAFPHWSHQGQAPMAMLVSSSRPSAASNEQLEMDPAAASLSRYLSATQQLPKDVYFGRYGLPAADTSSLQGRAYSAEANWPASSRLRVAHHQALQQSYRASSPSSLAHVPSASEEGLLALMRQHSGSQNGSHGLTHHSHAHASSQAPVPISQSSAQHLKPAHTLAQLQVRQGKGRQ